MLLLAVAGALTLGGCKESLSDKQFGAKVRAYLLEHPEVLRETAEALDKKEALAATSKLGKALEANRKALERDARDFVANPNGKITVVQFFDYNCGYCKIAAPEVLALIKSEPDVRFVFKEWPVIGGRDSERAAKVMLSLKASGGDYLGLYSDYIAVRPLTDQGIDVLAARHGLDARALEAAADKNGASKHLTDTKALARELGFSGTPTFVINNHVIEGGDIEKLKLYISEARKA
jgi:protein-disulfide isomerase